MDLCFPGKSTWLNSELTQLADKGFRVLKITHLADIRTDVANCDDSGSTHNSSYTSLTAKVSRLRTDQLAKVTINDFHVIGIDESQFYPDLLETVTHWVEVLGKHVRVTGLDGDAKKRKFGQTLDLIPICDEVIKLQASCHYCLEELRAADFHGNLLAISGPFTKRLGGLVSNIDIGGSDKYVPVCRYHHS